MEKKILSMITFTIGNYEIMEFMGKDKVVRVYMYDDNNQYRGYMDFIKEYGGTTNFIVHSNGIINAFISLDKLHLTLDILRNEKPVYFSVNQAYNWAAIKTGREPTGEEETP